MVTASADNCCAKNGATMGSADNNLYCNAPASCLQAPAAPPNADATYCCNITDQTAGVALYGGQCLPGSLNICVFSNRITMQANGSDCCAGNGVTHGTDGKFYCNPPAKCLPPLAVAPLTPGNACDQGNETADVDCNGPPDMTYCCTGGGLLGIEDTHNNYQYECCSLTGQNGGHNGQGCCAQNGVDANGNCNAPDGCASSGKIAYSPDGSDCCNKAGTTPRGVCN
jgi:hypothetical protein